MRWIFIIGLGIALTLFNCTWFSIKGEETAQELANRGMDEFNSGSYRVSIEVFEKLKNWYPFSKYAILAELKIADSHYNLGKFEEAITAYEEFEKLHPRNEATPYVINQIGLSYFGQVSTIDRDQKSAEKALETFQRLAKQFPDSLYAIRAKENIKKCEESLASHELEIGLFYYKSKHYEAAIHRFKRILSKYADVGEIHHQALQFLALSEVSLQKQQAQKQ
jgi:outer membrane protein assembly factor BamD